MDFYLVKLSSHKLYQTNRASLRRLNLFLFRLLRSFDCILLGNERQSLPFLLFLEAGNLVLHALLERSLTFVLYDGLLQL